MVHWFSRVNGKGVLRRAMVRGAVACSLVAATYGMALAHFGMVIPSASVAVEKDQAALSLQVSFSHPMELQGMDMAAPQEFAVIADGRKTDLTGGLEAATVMGHKAWKAEYQIKRPGVAQFYVIPRLYWEPAEDCYIQHLTKTYVASFGEEEGWDVPAGLRTEIVPLTRPFANYAGNVFQGRVLMEGKPVAGAVVEVEYYNKEGRYAAPNEYFVTQSVLTDADGVFTYAVPWAGWWGFAALNTAPEKIDNNGEKKDLELGAVLWTEFLEPMKK
ncbi:Nickel transport complex protein, NikM subunit, transmembrane [Oleidesulfovibrio alaskensis G20]|uniref:Nickel transport complex protein, NikM subunit, transmembrane n=1 Tax=Oleidesulfovibrio alaskensis (strain ATCC BAA-1058 / DSM 17464 / G20) TaxID=207559 RepID=Q313A6_OLEA2|nr:Nickel transport complex protein, NikM subunit, transmembrane [Oleidesulfovibrio alaskensis G20]